MTTITAVSVLAVPWDETAVIGGYYRERFARGSLTRGLATRPVIPLLYAHQNDVLPIGQFDPASWQDHPSGMVGLALLDTDDPYARAVGAKVANGYLTGCSVGFIPHRARWENAATRWDPGDTSTLDLCTRMEAELVEVSLTPTPAYAGARVIGHTLAKAIA